MHYWPNEGPSSDINNGVAVAGWIHSALVVGEASAWLYWWYQASGRQRRVGPHGSSTLTKRCYTLGNYSKFVRPGYVMVDVTGNSNTNLLLSAFTGYGRHRRRGRRQQGHVGSHRADHHRWRDGTGLVHAERDLVERQPRGRDRGHGDGRDLHCLARRHDRHDVRLQVAPAWAQRGAETSHFVGNRRGRATRRASRARTLVAC